MSGTQHKELEDLLRAMTAREASDLHLVPGHQPTYRIHGRLAVAGPSVLTSDRVWQLIRGIAPAGMPQRIEEAKDLDFAVQISDGSMAIRFRANVFRARGEWGACFRAIPTEIPAIESLGFRKDVADRILALDSGLVLVTGSTGSGKSTSIAALLDRLNRRGNCRIITIEQPIEYLHAPVEGSIVTQREVGADVASFSEGLRYGLRQDPDVILVGEIRDRETAELALSAAETGHLIFGTVHSADVKGAITRLVNIFPADLHEDVRIQLSLSLRLVAAQHLLPAPDGGRRVLAMEVLTANFALRSAIRGGKFESIDSAVQSGRQDGMFSLDVDLQRLVSEKRITLETAKAYAKDPGDFAGN